MNYQTEVLSRTRLRLQPGWLLELTRLAIAILVPRSTQVGSENELIPYSHGIWTLFH